MTVLDASAVMALLQQEPGADRVLQAVSTSVLPMVNLAEVLGKAADRGIDPARHLALFDQWGLALESVQRADVLRSADIRRRETAERRPVLSLADRLCLAVAGRLGVPALTADRAWADIDLGIEVELIR